ncbi:hypothetical protein BDFB_012165 [Asbolus verrucosus]|uniref:Uncharacterized protein n=1 Tax=Asbolus verrucosus TaxID=1661398 RepID=A0A482W0G4_ASBVE|nr:hypothetical protein BDFB_012165 [Asbolus verrucosus]
MMMSLNLDIFSRTEQQPILHKTL